MRSTHFLMFPTGFACPYNFARLTVLALCAFLFPYNEISAQECKRCYAGDMFGEKALLRGSSTGARSGFNAWSLAVFGGSGTREIPKSRIFAGDNGQSRKHARGWLRDLLVS